MLCVFFAKDIPPSPEVATFTVFFMAFTAMIGKELLQLDYEADSPGKTILSTYVPSLGADTVSESVATEELSLGTSDDGLSEMKASRPELGSFLHDNGGDHAPIINTEDVRDVAKNQARQSNTQAESPNSDEVNGEALQPRRRFTDSLSALEIEEAKATGRAQLGLAFEMLTMMKKRALRADPEAYQCLIDACGRVGDTKRATDLLAKMHEDGIVADGTVYACLVSAFSAETAWKKGTKEEDLPGKIKSGSIVAQGSLDQVLCLICLIFFRMGEQHRC